MVDEDEIRLNGGSNLSSIKNGSCRVYDNTTMSQNVMGVSLGWKIMSTLFMTLALYFSKKSDRKENEAKQKYLHITNSVEKKAHNQIKEEEV